MNNTPQKTAVALQRKHLLGRPTLEDLVALINEQGYEIIDFDPDDKSIEILSQRLSLTPMILNQDAFSFYKGNVRLLFIRSTLTSQEKLLAMTHELGHMVLGHLRTGRASSVIEEYEANEFVHYFLNPSFTQISRTFIQHHRRATVVTFCVIILAIIGVSIVQHKIAESQYEGNYYVTTSGTKFHLRECSSIVNKTNVRRITAEEMKQYEPCKLCLPDLQR